MIIGLLMPLVGWAQPVLVEDLRMWPSPNSTRLVFDLSGPVTHRLFSLANPDRLVIDLSNAQLARPIEGAAYSGELLKGIRAAARNQHDLRVVLDLKQEVRPKSFVLRPNQEYGHRLVVDLENPAAPRPAVPVARQSGGDSRALRDIVVAIDAGHGGEDPGAIGPGGTREKDVVLAIARRLAHLVEREPGMRPLLIRTGDYYVSLQNRVDMARRERADIFISIHADAFPDQRARGASVYTLSQRGASSEYARLLADRENASDLVGGVRLDDKDDLLASVLLDLSQSATIEASNEVGASILAELKGVGRVHKRQVEHASFRVLRAPDVPSILVEAAFISNPQEERQLRSSSHQNALAQALMSGIRTYFRHNPPPGTRLAQGAREHVINRGETLSGIARNYQVPVNQLRSFNGLEGDVVRAGQVLRIPPG